MKTFCILCLFILSSCGKVCWHEANQQERQRIFKDCMLLLPTGPVSTQYNDWAEVVEECDNAAYQQSLVKKCNKE
jgi:hypothetical protein